MPPETPQKTPKVVLIVGALLFIGGITNAVLTGDLAWAVVGVLTLCAATAFALAEADGGGR